MIFIFGIRYQYENLMVAVARLDENAKQKVFNSKSNPYAATQITYEKYCTKTNTLWGKIKSLIPITAEYSQRKECAKVIAESRDFINAMSHTTKNSIKKNTYQTTPKKVEPAKIEHQKDQDRNNNQVISIEKASPKSRHGQVIKYMSLPMPRHTKPAYRNVYTYR